MIVERPVPVMEPDRRPGRVVEGLGHDDVVRVRVGEEDALHVQTAAQDVRQHVLARDRRIDDDGVLGAVARQEIEIVLERADRKPFDPHAQALQAVMAVIPNMGSPTISTSLNPVCSRSV